eukprot:2747850-Pleurochrysis_carterae.AAC.3
MHEHAMHANGHAMHDASNALDTQAQSRQHGNATAPYVTVQEQVATGLFLLVDNSHGCPVEFDVR